MIKRFTKNANQTNPRVSYTPRLSEATNRQNIREYP